MRMMNGALDQNIIKPNASCLLSSWVLETVNK